MNVPYNIVQGVNFIKIPDLNIKRLSNIQNIIKGIDENEDNFYLKRVFDDQVVIPNLVNIKNPSRDSVLYFSNRDDVSRQNYDFRVFPKQEINYYFHENKQLYCYLTQLNVSSLNIDINWNYNYEKNIPFLNDFDKNQVKYECLKIFEDEVISDGVTTWSSNYPGCNWVRYFNLAIKTNQNYDLDIKRKNGLDIETYQSSLISGAGATSVYASLFYIPSNTASIQSLMENFSFGITNNSGGADLTASLYIEMFG